MLHFDSRLHRLPSLTIMLGIIRCVYSTATRNSRHAFFADRPEGIIEIIEHCIDVSINGSISQ